MEAAPGGEALRQRLRQPRAGRLAKSPKVEIGTRASHKAARGGCGVRAVLHAWTLKQTPRGLSKDLSLERCERLEESPVLGASAIGDPQMTGTAEGRAGADGDTGLGE